MAVGGLGTKESLFEVATSWNPKVFYGASIVLASSMHFLVRCSSSDKIFKQRHAQDHLCAETSHMFDDQKQKIRTAKASEQQDLPPVPLKPLRTELAGYSRLAGNRTPALVSSPLKNRLGLASIIRMAMSTTKKT